MEDLDSQNVQKEFSGLTVSLVNGSRAKKRLSNRLTINVPTDRAEVSVSMTIREAQALRNFLNKHLG